MDVLDRDEWPALFPDKAGGTSEAIERRMGGLRFTQSHDERLHFTLLAPEGWRWRPPHEAGDPPGLLVSLVRGAPAEAEIAVFVDEVPREVGPAEWTIHRLERDGHVVWAKREADTPIGAMADLLTRKEEPRGVVIARTNMAKDGKRIFTITCQARGEDYPRWASDFYVTLASFKLLRPERAPLAERLTSYCYLYPAVVGFSYPASWKLEEEVLSAAACDVRLDDMNGDRVVGSVHVSARSDARPRRMIAEYFDRLNREGVRVEGRPDLAPCNAPKGFDEAFSLPATGTRDGREVEVRAMVLAAPKATLLLAACGPARAQSAVDWMVQKRAFEIVRDTIYAV